MQQVLAVVELLIYAREATSLVTESLLLEVVAVKVETG
jgi:hypothetical protein